MPELPEVESVRRGLAAHVVGKTVNTVDILHPRAVRDHCLGPEDFAHRWVGHRIDDVRRRGKFLWFALAGGDAVVAHLGMSGQFRIDLEDPPHRHTRLQITFDDGSRCAFVDQRMFGGMRWSDQGAENPPEIAHIALDPLDVAFDTERAVEALRRRRSAVKHVLLDQGWVSGIGNIYADESLWRAKLHPLTPAEAISVAKARELMGHVRDVLAAALEQGGTSFDSLYVHVNGDSGYFDRSLAAYGREGQACLRCGEPIVREKFENRSSYRCRRCQRRRSAVPVTSTVGR